MSRPGYRAMVAKPRPLRETVSIDYADVLEQAVENERWRIIRQRLPEGRPCARCPIGQAVKWWRDRENWVTVGLTAGLLTLAFGGWVFLEFVLEYPA